MTIILFLIDTSASMNARTYLGARPTLLDVSKDAVEKFLKLRQRDIASRGDRYMLLTFEESPINIKAGWKENHNVFMTELKNLTANGMTTLGPALKNCFDLLNLNRMQQGIDFYGHGRPPYYLEPAVIIVITDGGKLTNTSNVQEELNLPMHSCVPGSELTKEPFRWDQRLFSLVLRLTGTPPADQFNGTNGAFLPYDNSSIDAMCEVTGGRSYMVNSQRSLNFCLESIVQKIQGGVVLQFEKFGPDPPPVSLEEQQQPPIVNQQPPLPQQQQQPNSMMPIAPNPLEELDLSKLSIVNNNPNSQFKHWHTCRKQIYVRIAQKGYSVGHWPIPEAFWPDINSPSLPHRTCHPIVKFTCTNNDPMMIENLPFDKYEIESCQLTNYILLRKQPQIAWQCFISNSGFYHSNNKNDLGLPFGYLKASTNLTCVNLYVLPYNYPVLLPLLDELFKVHHGKPSREWKMNFDCYLKTMPPYYALPLKRALQRMSAPNLVPDSMENFLSYHVINYLNKIKKLAKNEFEKLVASVGKMPPHSHIDSIKLVNNPYTKRLHDLVLTALPNNENIDKRNEKNTDSALLKNQKFLQSIRNDLNDFNGFVIRIRDKMKEAKPQCFKNAFDINRNDLIDQISRMKINFLQRNLNDIKVHTDEQLHSLPIAQMGNYQEYLKKLQPSLRELEQQPVRQHMFGNPFKFDKKVQMMVDEADIDLMNNGGVNNGNKGLNKRPATSDLNLNRYKRRPGPLSKDFILKRPGSPALNNNNNLNNNNPQQPNNIQQQQPPINNQTPIMNGLNGLNGTPPANENQPAFIKSADGDSVINNRNLTNNFAKSSLSSSIDSYSDNSLSSSNSSLSDGNQSDSDLETSSTSSISSLMSSSLSSTTTQLNNISNKPLTGLHLLNKQMQNNSYQPPINHLNHINYSTQNNLINLSDDDIQLKKVLFKIIRRPGSNYEQLINSLLKHNNIIVKNYLVHEVLNEAKRFKKKQLIHLLVKKFPNCKSFLNGSS